MTEPQRWRPHSDYGPAHMVPVTKGDSGGYVAYDVHVSIAQAAVAEAEQRAADDPGPLAAHYTKGAADERDKIAAELTHEFWDLLHMASRGENRGAFAMADVALTVITGEETTFEMCVEKYGTGRS